MVYVARHVRYIKNCHFIHFYYIYREKMYFDGVLMKIEIIDFYFFAHECFLLG